MAMTAMTMATIITTTTTTLNLRAVFFLLRVAGQSFTAPARFARVSEQARSHLRLELWVEATQSLDEKAANAEHSQRGRRGWRLWVDATQSLGEKKRTEFGKGGLFPQALLPK